MQPVQQIRRTDKRFRISPAQLHFRRIELVHAFLGDRDHVSVSDGRQSFPSVAVQIVCGRFRYHHIIRIQFENFLPGQLRKIAFVSAAFRGIHASGFLYHAVLEGISSRGKAGVESIQDQNGRFFPNVRCRVSYMVQDQTAGFLIFFRHAVPFRIHLRIPFFYHLQIVIQRERRFCLVLCLKTAYLCPHLIQSQRIVSLRHDPPAVIVVRDEAGYPAVFIHEIPGHERIERTERSVLPFGQEQEIRISHAWERDIVNTFLYHRVIVIQLISVQGVEDFSPQISSVMRDGDRIAGLQAAVPAFLHFQIVIRRRDPVRVGIDDVLHRAQNDHGTVRVQRIRIRIDLDVIGAAPNVILDDGLPVDGESILYCDRVILTAMLPAGTGQHADTEDDGNRGNHFSDVHGASPLLIRRLSP